MATLQNWLACLEIVGLVAVNAIIWPLIKIPLAYLLMIKAELGLVGFCHAYALATVGELIGVWLVVFKWKKRHIIPTRWWHGL
eukprot:COSAG02_NODE_15669_length_1150_cov_1.120837_1_plen_82_part_10